jgi:phage repressor protein C with HTH and peptisase S24 domain
MLTHDSIWQGIDRLASTNGLSPSGLARRAGLDPTTFNRSKRVTREAKPRWPSTESLAKILDATSTPFDDFVALVMGDRVGGGGSGGRLPFLPFDEANAASLFDDSGFPATDGWEEVEFPGIDDRYAYALEVRGERMQPVYRDGDILILSPTAQIRRGDRVVVCGNDHELLAGTLVRKTAQRLQLTPFGSEEEVTRRLAEVAWLTRIVWASQ